jgi:hypothetical protein
MFTAHMHSAGIAERLRVGHRPHAAARGQARLRLALAAWAGLTLATALAAAGEPFLSLEKGFASDSPLLRPGKLDFLYRYREAESSYNAFAWTPTFKGGAGVLDPKDAHPTSFGGGFLRPLAPWPEKGDLILGAQALEAPNRSDFEFQGEYRLPMGLGLGGGLVEARETGADVVFGKLTFRRKAGSWNYILELQGQSVNDQSSPGGYFALYNDQLMGVGGTDGEQWRVTVGYVAPWTNAFVRPTLEVLYTDNSIGDLPGVKQLFANATLKYQGGFLSHPARLGRAMGPQGLEFGNPLGFLVPTWNRRLDPWEMGNLLDLRAEHITLPNRSTQERYEAMFFPFQFAQTKTVLDCLFVGGSYFKNPKKETPGLIAGFTGKVAFLNLSVGVEHQFEPNDTIVTVGVIDPF